jgi:hypothetical protein
MGTNTYTDMAEFSLAFWVTREQNLVDEPLTHCFVIIVQDHQGKCVARTCDDRGTLQHWSEACVQLGADQRVPGAHWLLLVKCCNRVFLGRSDLYDIS